MKFDNGWHFLLVWGRRMGRYSAEQVRKMSPIQLWFELGLHRGLIGERTVKVSAREAESGAIGPKVFRYYSLGLVSDVGLEDRFGRRVLHVQAPGAPSFLVDELRGGPWQGPVVVESSSPQHADAVRRTGAEALRALAPPKPKFKLSGGIAHEDRPDVGAAPQLPSPTRRRLFTVKKG